MVKLQLDELLGSDNFRNEIVWHYKFRMMRSTRIFNRKHDNLFLYGRSDRAELRTITEEWTRDDILARRKQAVYKDTDGREWIWMPGGRGHSKNKKKYLDEIMDEGKALDDVWDLPIVTSSANERTGYATQKPKTLLHRIVDACSGEGSLVADFFIGCDLGRWGIHVTRKRLLGIENCKPFEVLNLGKYERLYWQSVTFGEKKDKSLAEQAFYEYLAFILKLYGAQPVGGMTHLHGKKGKAMVHIGAVDAPVTIAEIDAAVDECAKVKQGALHVLGWEWGMGLYDLMVEVAKKKGVKLLLLQIPREVMEQQAVAKGDVRFFELAYLEAEIKQLNKLTAQVALKDFVIPNTELIPEDVRSKVKKWSDYIDYWAVDWDFQNDTFMQGWVAYRTRKERKLPLVSDPHPYEKRGRYRILVKVIDIFGNDTSQAFDVEVM
jgi:adenine-specific DNA-methyltransferase